MSIDLLMVDEAYAFKNMYVPLRLTVAGAPQADSLHALDLRIKTWDVLRQGQKTRFPLVSASLLLRFPMR